MQPESSLFEVRFTEQGKSYLRKFTAISYFVIGLSVIVHCIHIYWNIKYIISYANREFGPLKGSLYNKFFPYVSMLYNLLVIIFSVYFMRFPRELMSCLTQGDEYGANKTFQLLLKGAWVFLIWLILIVGQIVWNLLSR